jgi:hypothetical protein
LKPPEDWKLYLLNDEPMPDDHLLKQGQRLQVKLIPKMQEIRAFIKYEQHTIQQIILKANPVKALKKTVGETWMLPADFSYLTINGKHESISPAEWMTEIAVQVRVKDQGDSTPPMGSVKLHLKTKTDGRIYELKLRDNVSLEDVATLVEDIFEDLTDVKLYRDGAELSLAEEMREWMSETDGISPFMLKTRLKLFR